jgi:Cupin domain
MAVHESIDNPDGRATLELTALVEARVVGEHRHPALVERFTVLEGEPTLKLDGQTSILREGESAVIEAVSGTTGGMRATATPGGRWSGDERCGELSQRGRD